MMKELNEYVFDLMWVLILLVRQLCVEHLNKTFSFSFFLLVWRMPNELKCLWTCRILSDFQSCADWFMWTLKSVWRTSTAKETVFTQQNRIQFNGSMVWWQTATGKSKHMINFDIQFNCLQSIARDTCSVFVTSFIIRLHLWEKKKIVYTHKK